MLLGIQILIKVDFFIKNNYMGRIYNIEKMEAGEMKNLFDTMKVKKSYDALLNQYFGHKELKKEQFEIINKLLNDKRDVCGVMATGYGKSICYQLPFVIMRKTVLVISPLIALMQDQKINLEKRGVPVCCLNGQTSNKNGLMLELMNGGSKCVFSTPEFIVGNLDFVRELASKDLLGMICIDEAHCVSTWGHDFRVSYTKLNLVRDNAPGVPMLALTGTATPKVRVEICKLLKLNNPHIVIGTFNRPNLYIEIKYKLDDGMSDLRGIVEKYVGEKVIVYCKTIKDTGVLREMLEEHGVGALVYHAGLGGIERTDVQRRFTEGECKCILATIAFGMGIDIPDIRCVIHYGCPKNIESYYQEIGRAGRDGKKSECFMLYSGRDFIVSRAFLKNIESKGERDYQEEQIRMIEKYVNATCCRRHMILEHFHDFQELKNLKELKNGCNNCDNCISSRLMEGYHEYVSTDFTVEAKQILETLRELVEKHNMRYGSGMVLNILMGSNAASVKPELKKLKHYGVGKGKRSKEEWKSIIKNLKFSDYLIEKQIKGKFGMIVLECTDKGVKLLGDNLAKIVVRTGVRELVAPVEEEEEEELVEVPKENREEIVGKLVAIAYRLYKSKKESMENLVKLTGLGSDYLKKSFDKLASKAK
ncbi:MAG: DEAD/SNF2-like helicase [Hyperionvirus sp.]|uniref:DEAD/SNF2-like helicase n=1 Tax=Hyperionvirus sp. TaxID=2487770 RepID=A0A3G5ABK6_9VIRU|nr:MAG: DEAD/SNF2-like helicase [Hyperionvirus sp.]